MLSMKKMIFASLVACLFVTPQTYADTTEMTNGVPLGQTTTTQPSAQSMQQQSANGLQQAAVGPTGIAAQNSNDPAPKAASKKKKFNFWGLFDFIGRIEAFVKGKTKQNENVIDDAANGEFKMAHKRAIAADPAARRVQEKMDKAQAERLQKLESVVGN